MVVSASSVNNAIKNDRDVPSLFADARKAPRLSEYTHNVNRLQRRKFSSEIVFDLRRFLGFVRCILIARTILNFFLQFVDFHVHFLYVHVT